MKQFWGVCASIVVCRVVDLVPENPLLFSCPIQYFWFHTTLIEMMPPPDAKLSVLWMLPQPKKHRTRDAHAHSSIHQYHIFCSSSIVKTQERSKEPSLDPSFVLTNGSSERLWLGAGDLCHCVSGFSAQKRFDLSCLFLTRNLSIIGVLLSSCLSNLFLTLYYSTGPIQMWGGEWLIASLVAEVVFWRHCCFVLLRCLSTLCWLAAQQNKADNGRTMMQQYSMNATIYRCWRCSQYGLDFIALCCLFYFCFDGCWKTTIKPKGKQTRWRWEISRLQQQQHNNMRRVIVKNQSANPWKVRRNIANIIADKQRAATSSSSCKQTLRIKITLRY